MLARNDHLHTVADNDSATHVWFRIAIPTFRLTHHSRTTAEQSDVSLKEEFKRTFWPERKLYEKGRPILTDGELNQKQVARKLRQALA